MKKRWLSRMLCICMAMLLLTGTAAGATFPDVDEYSEYYSAVDYVSDKGIIVGDSAGNFNPHQSVTRAQMAVILCRVLEMTENLPTSTKFADVPVDYWANAYIAKAEELGIVNGYSNGTFGPGGFVTYEQAITMVIRSLDDGTARAQTAGGYPDGFLTVAADDGLIDRLSAKKGEVLSRGDIAQLLFNYYIAYTTIE